jgi:PKD repeat protein
VGDAAFFNGSRSHAEGVEITSWSWDFGDGTTEEGEQVSHTYTESGEFVVTLMITTDSAGACKVVSAQKFIFVNRAPVADAGQDQIVGVNDPVAFSGAGSKDADGAISSYEWDFGDGHMATGFQVLHRYGQSGRYPVVLRVQDDTQVTNNTATDTIYVTVNAPPLPQIDGPAFTCMDEAAHFNAVRSTDTDGEILEYQWRFGDGGTAKGAEVTHAWKTTGRFPVTLAVKDDTEANNAWQQQSQTVTVNRTPIADAGPNRLVCVGEAIEFDGSASLDPDGTLVGYHWRFGDGAEADGSLVRHTYDQPGNYAVNLSIEDNSNTTCGSAASAAQVRVNTRPVAKADAERVGYTGGAHDDLVFDGSESYDPDGDILSYRWDFGDGNVKRGSKVHHYFQNPGYYTVRLTVQDDTGLGCGVATDEVTVTIRAR